MKRIQYILIAILLAVLVVGCDRRPLEDELGQTSRIPIKVYWDQAGIAPQNVTVLFYDESGKLHSEWVSSSLPTYAEGFVDMTPGTYTAVVFNELRNQIDNVNMQGWDVFDTFQAYAVQDTVPLYTFPSVQEKETLVRQPGILAICSKEFTITAGMVGCNQYAITDTGFYALSDLHPQRRTANAHIKVHAGRLNNALMPAVAQLRGMASGYIFATDRNTLHPVASQFTINNRSYTEGSNTDGTVSTTITTFGMLGEWDHIGSVSGDKVYLDVAFMLADEKRTIVEYTFDVTDRMEITVNEYNAVTISIEIEIGLLPDIQPGGENSGFETDLVDWNKVVIPLNSN